MKVKEIVDMLDRRFPADLQEKYDNTGGQVIFAGEAVSGILLALDAGVPVLSEAEERRCNLIVTHHPFFFMPMKSVVSTDPRAAVLLRAMEAKISLYAAHTNLDKVFFDRLQKALELGTGEVLVETGKNPDGGAVGFGTLCRLDQPVSLERLLSLVKERLGLGYLLYSGNPEMQVRTVALLNGSGGKSVRRIAESGRADCIVTGDVGYHEAVAAAEYGTAVIDAGHFGTERILLRSLREEIAEMTGAPIFVSEREKDPFRVY